MKSPKITSSSIANQQGVVAIMVGFAMLFLLFFAALAVDIGYVLTTKNELQNIADAAALAAAGRLAEFYDSGQIPIESSVKLTATTVASMNWVGGEDGDGTVVDSNIELGTWKDGQFTVSPYFLYAARISARRDGETGIAIPTFFAKLFGIDSVNLRAMAIAEVPTADLGGFPYPTGAPPRLVK